MKSLILASASVIALSSTHAFALNEVYSGGSTAASNVYRDLYNCATHPLLHGVNDDPSREDAGVNAPTTVLAGCPSGTGVDTTTEILYAPTGSGAALTAITTGAPINLGAVSATNKVAYVSTTSATPNPEIDFGASDSPLPTGVAYPGVHAPQIVIQIPTAEIGVAVSVNITTNGLATGKVLNLQWSKANLCNFFKGKINNWDQLTASKKALYDPTDPANQAKDSNGNPIATKFVTGPNLPITFEERSDGSGTTYLFTNYVKSQCNPAGFTGPSDQPTVWASLPAHTFTTHQDSGSGGVAGFVAANIGVMGYVSSDFVKPQSATGPSAAFVANNEQFTPAGSAKQFYYTVPTQAGVADALSGVAVPPKHYTGNPVPTAKSSAGNIVDWNLAFAGPKVGKQVSKATDAYLVGGFTFTDVLSCGAVRQAQVSNLISYIFNAANVAKVNEAYAPAQFASVNGTPLTAINSILRPLIKAGVC